MSLFNNPGRMGGFSAHDYNESELYAWGESASGRLGNGTITPDVTAPQRITSAMIQGGQGAISQWSNVAAGSGFAHATTRFNTFYGWGLDGDDAIGNSGSQVNKSSPVYVWGGNRQFIAASGGGSHGAVVTRNHLTDDQFLYTWGGNYNGELGVGDTTNRTTPAAGNVSGTTWASVSCGDQITAAIKTDNTLWTFGAGANGILGDGTAVDKSSPVQIGSTVWSYVDAGDEHMLAIRTDGTLWGWGLRQYGAVGDLSTSTSISSPVQIGAATTWTQVAASLNNSAGIQSDGTLWTWGRGDIGALGNGSTASHYSSPVQVGSNTDWAFVDTGSHYMLALTTRGEIFSWGNNASGQLGLGDTTRRSSPVQVGSLKNWLQVSCGEAGAASFARRR